MADDDVPGSGPGVLGEDLAVEVGDDDRVAGPVSVADDEDLCERVGATDLVGRPVEADGAGGAHRSWVCAGG
ncbi:hypothetical protein PSU4_01020 [Pseudonocardia sulfidoxydans NBRC 16205]|uniref:Uncharacterized protein n=1 Tax=Pseudonocardia sulfidoxydans NBRC 16205 TaxID=1223511 RepID=A0A511DDU2_9PSEU|nr:hypothetical protein PSU4_01020 [Pseudonocardia sulfidoxydans NBRC 16205]